MLELATDNLTVIETQGSYTVTVRRLYGTSGTVTADYMISNSFPLFTRVENIFGRLVFNENQTELTLTGKVYKRQYVEQNNELATFVLSLFNPSMNSELGYNRDLTLNYFDDEFNMNDAYYT